MGVRLDPVHNVPNRESLASEWIMWHKAMLPRYGKKQANILFLKAWKKRNQDGFVTDGKANTVELREHLEKHGVKVERGTISYVADFADDIGDTISDVIGFGVTASIATGVIIFAVIVWAFIRIIRKPNDYTELVKLAATRGMVK